MQESEFLKACGPQKPVCQPNESVDPDIDGLCGRFGMYEMEQAAIVILKRCRENDSWFEGFGYNQFKTDHEQKGFLNLLAYGWLNPTIFKDSFMVKDIFVERVSPGWKPKESSHA